MTTLATCWSMTINNPEPNDEVLVQNPNPDYIRQLIWTLEVGEDGTPHIQAFLRLQKQQRLSFVKKLYPRGHFKSITSDCYKQSCIAYAQKTDETTASSHVITMNEPIPDCVMFLSKVVKMCVEDAYLSIDLEPKEWIRLHYNQDKMIRELEFYERQEVVRRPLNAKLIVSPTYSRVKKLYLQEITENIISQLHIQDETTSEEQQDSELHETLTLDGVSSEEEDCEEDCETDGSTDASGSEDSEQED